MWRIFEFLKKDIESIGEREEVPLECGKGERQRSLEMRTCVPGGFVFFFSVRNNVCVYDFELFTSENEDGAVSGEQVSPPPAVFAEAAAPFAHRWAVQE